MLTEGKKEGKKVRRETGQMGSLAQLFSRTRGEKTLLTNVTGMQKKGIAFLSVAFFPFLLLLYFYLKRCIEI